MTFTDQQKSTLMGIGVAALLLVAGFGYYLYMFGKDELAGYEKDADEKEKNSLAWKIARDGKELKRVRELLAHEDELQAELESFAKVEERLPKTSNARGFYKELVDTLRTTGIYQDRVRTVTPKNRVQYTEIPYSIKAIGRYHEFGYFLTMIEQNPQRFMTVKNFTLDLTDARPTMHPISLEVATFMFNE